MLYYVDRDEMMIYRFEARALRNRDNREIARLRLEIDERAENKAISHADLLFLYNWPVLKHGALVFDEAVLKALPETEDVPDGLDWQPVDLNEQKFEELTEELTVLCFDAVMERNPYRSLETAFLKKTMELLGDVSATGLSALSSSRQNGETPSENSSSALSTEKS